MDSLNCRRFFVAAGLVTLTSVAAGQHCETVLLTQSSAGTQGVPGGGLGATAIGISADGRYVAFVSTQVGLVPDDPYPGHILGQVYVRDVLAGTIEMANVDSNENAPDEPGTATAQVGVSDDGRYVVFDSPAKNLHGAGSDTNLATDVFLRDRILGTTRRISVAADGTQGNASSTAPSISADGRWVAFASDATNLVPGDTNGAADVFVVDLTTGAVDHVSTDSFDLQGTGASTRPDISADGRYVAFLSWANLGAPHGNPQVFDAFVKDRTTRAIQLVSLSSWGEPANHNIEYVRVSADGNRLVFVSSATNLVIQGELNFNTDVFLRDRASGTTVRVSHPVGSPFGHSNGQATDASISDDGRWVAFTSSASDLIAPPIEANGDDDVFVHDTALGTFEQVSRAVDGAAADGPSLWSRIAGDGRAVAFVTYASNLAPGDANGGHDVVEFRRDCLSESSTPFCFGDGSGTACPCGNNGSQGNGCASSVNSFGANLVSTGLASVSIDTFTLRGSGLTNSVVTYYQGTQRTNGGAGAVFGDGLRCASGTTIRLGAINSPGGASRYPNAGDLPISIKGAIPAGGGVTRAYQVRYRNADPTFCTPAAFNLTNGVEATWVP